MNKLEELEKQYVKLGEEIEKLKKGKEDKYFVPKEDEQYYMLAGKRAEHNHNNSDYDKEVFKRQMVYRTEAEAEALKVQKQEITADLLELRKIENESKMIDKWNGQLPTYMMGETLPFLNVK